MSNSIRRLISLVLALALVLGLAPATAWTISAEETDTKTITAADFAGKKVSILGDSISTFTGISDNTEYNTTIGSNAVYYKTPGQNGIYQEGTWWQQVIDLLDMELCVNNSWSGSCILSKRNGTVGCYVDRCVQLHNNNTNVDPDVILIFMGTNDFSYYSTATSSNGDKWGDFDVESACSVITQEDGVYSYATPQTVYEAYAITLNKIQVRYPDAEVYCMGLMARRNPDYTGDSFADVGQPTVQNAGLKALAEAFGYTYIDMESCIGSDAAIFDVYMADKRVHPNAEGMDQMTKAVISGMLGLENGVHEISYDLANVTADTDAEMVAQGKSFEVTLTKGDGYTGMDVTVTMGGMDITKECYSDGKITISEVTGDVAITAQGVLTARYRWVMGTDGLVSIDTGGFVKNEFDKTTGTVKNGELDSYYASLTSTVKLSREKEWVIEWESNGDWTGMLLLSKEEPSTDNAVYLYRNKNKLLVIGNRKNSQYNNYGIDTTGFADDSTVRTFRLENRVAADGSNMVYLVIDDFEIGAMNNYYIASESQNCTSDWLAQNDLTFSYIGSTNTTFDISNMALSYLEINTENTEHKCAYKVTEETVAGTCQSEGYTVYKCTCGETKNVSTGVKGDHEYGVWQEVDGAWQRGCMHCDSSEIAAAVINGATGYLTLEDALETAVEGDTVAMWTDATVEYVELSKGITLDLNGHILTAEYAIAYKGNNIVDGSDTNGVLKVKKGSLSVQNTNTYLPIWNGTDGYVFTDCMKCQEMTSVSTDKETGKEITTFYFLPWMDEIVHAYLAAGSETSGVELKVMVSYTLNGVEKELRCNFTDELVQRFYEGYKDGVYAYAFRLTLTGTDIVDENSLNFTVCFVGNGVIEQMNEGG